MNKPKVLIVDDEKNVRLMLKNSLSDLGYDVLTAVNGEDGLEKMSQQEVDIVLLDMKLPGMEGMDVLSEIHQKHPNAQVIMVTAYGTVETAVEAMKLGAIDFLRKPFSPEQIRELVAEVLERRLLKVDELTTCDDLLQYAKYLLNKCEYKEAENFLHQAVAMDPSKPEPFNLMGVICEFMGKIDEARKMYRAALALNSMYKPADANLSRISAFPYTQRGIDLGDNN